MSVSDQLVSKHLGQGFLIEMYRFHESVSELYETIDSSDLLFLEELALLIYG